MTPAPSRLRRVVRFFVGDRPWMIFLIYSPTLIAIALDLFVRPAALARLSAGFMALYVGSAIAGAGIWGAVLWFASRLFLVRSGRLAGAAKAATAIVFGGLFLPFACFAYGGQAAYYRAFTAYMSRDSVRIGVRLRGTVAQWISSWGGGLTAMIVGGVLVTAIVLVLVRRAAVPISSARPVLPVVGLGISLYCYGTDFIETRALQAAPPDACFMHGIVYAARMAAFKSDTGPVGVSLRTPAVIPKLVPAAHRPDVIVILSESLRADALCSAKTGVSMGPQAAPNPGAQRAPECDAPFLDASAPDRVALGKMTAQASGTFTSCLVLWTGMPVEIDFATAHAAPMLWEAARAAGYRTAYIGSQNLTFQDLGTFLQNAGIDLLVSAPDLGDAPDVFIGAPDERATARTLAYVREAQAGAPYFVMLHLSNTHWPYRVDPGLSPYEPHATGPLSTRETLLNHYRNSVRLQERTVAAFLDELKTTPRWRDTVVIYTADHGEQFREHRRLHHLNNLFDEEVRVPGWLVAGDRALDDAQRQALAAYAGRRTYGQDLHVTLLDLFGLYDQRDRIPFAKLRTGRSLLRAESPLGEPIVTSSTTSTVYEDDDPVYGARSGELLAVAADVGGFRCYDARTDPKQKKPVANRRCQALIDVAKERFPALRAKR